MSTTKINQMMILEQWEKAKHENMLFLHKLKHLDPENYKYLSHGIQFYVDHIDKILFKREENNVSKVDY